MRPSVFAPAVLAHTFLEFESQIKKIDIGLFPYVHIDVMDGKFVPHTSFKEIDRLEGLASNLPFELHLMVEDPLAELEKWAAVGNVFRIIFHIESGRNLDVAMALAEDTELAVGLAIKPQTPLSSLVHYLDRIDVAQFMTVNPGAQGEKFIAGVLENISEFNKSREGILTSVDGAVNLTTLPELIKRGVDIFTVGSAFRHAPDVKKTYKAMKAMIASQKIN